MGLFDALNALRDANISKHKLTKAEADAKIANLNAMGTLAELLQTQIQGTPGTPDQMGFNPQAQNVPAGANADLISGDIKSNPALTPQITPGTPGTPGKSLGDPLLDMLVPTVLRSGNVDAAAKVIEYVADPKRQFMKNILGGDGGSPVNLQPGQPGQATTTPGEPAPPVMDMFGQVIQKAAEGDPNALSMAAKLKGLGFDVAPLIERMQKSNEPIKRVIYDPANRQTYEALYKKFSGEYKEIPNTRNLIKPEEVQWIEEAIPGGGTRKVPYVGTKRVEPAPQGATTGTPPAPSNLKPFDISLPPGTPQEEIDRVTNSLRKSLGGGGVVTKYPESRVEIPSEQIGNWFNDKFENPPIGMTPVEAQKAGFKSHTAAGAQTMAKTKQALSIVNQLQDLSSELFPDPGLFNRIGAGAKAGYNLLTQDDPRYAEYTKLSMSVLGPLIRQLGEVGSLSDGDVQRAFNIMGKLWPLPDSKAVALGSWQEIRKIILKGTKFVEGPSISGENSRPSLKLGKPQPKGSTAGGSKRFQILKVE